MNNLRTKIVNYFDENKISYYLDDYDDEIYNKIISLFYDHKKPDEDNRIIQFYLGIYIIS